MLIELMDAIRDLDDPAAVMRTAAAALVEHLGVARVLWADVDPRQRVFTRVSDFGIPAPTLTRTFAIDDFGPDIGEAVRRGQTVVLTDVATDPRARPVQAAFNAVHLRSGICVPVVRHGRLAALVGAHQPQPRAWTEGEIRLVEEVAERVWPTVERARALQSVRESESRFRILAESLPQIVWTTTADGAVDYFNQRWREYVDPAISSTQLWDWTYMLHPEDEEATVQTWARSVREQAPYQMLHRIRRSDGAFRWHLSRGYPLLDDAGHLVKWVGTSTDIDDQKQAEERLRAGEHHLRSILDSLAAFVGVLHADGTVLQANRAVLEASDLRPEDVAGQTLDNTFWFTHSEHSRRSIGDAISRASGGETVRLDAVARVGNGEFITVDLTLAPMFDNAGQVTHIIASAIDITDRKAVEEAIRSSEARYRQLAEALPQLVWTCTAEGQCDYLSRQWCEYTGRPESEQLGRGWSQSLHPDDIPKARAAWEAAVKEQAGYDLEYRLRRADGEYRWFQTRGVPIRDARGVIVKWFGTCTDVHDRRLMEEALRYSEERYRLVIRATYDAVWDWDLVTNRIDWGEAFEVNFGYSPDLMQPNYEWWKSCLHPDDLQRVHERISAVILQGGEHWSDEYRFRRADGRYAHVLDRGYIVRDAEGRVVRMIGAMMDLTERKATEEALRTSEARFRQLADAMPQVVWSATPDGRFDYFNRRWTEITGLEQGPADAEDLQTALHPEDAEPYMKRWRECLQTGCTFQAEYRLRDRQEDVFRWHLARAVPISDEQGNIVRWFGTSTDIDDQKLAQERLAEIVEELNRSNRELEDFAHIASHDLKEPLRGIRNYASFLTEDYGQSMDPEGRRKLATIDRLCQRMDDLIRSLLYYSQVGRTEMAIADTDLNQVVLEVLESLGPMLSERGVDIRLPRPLPHVRCDRVRVAEVYRNLLTNSIKYNDKPDPWVEVSWRPPEQEGGEPVLFVRDNGIGIPEHHHRTVFGIFRRLHSRDEYGGGTGSGLAFVKRIVERHRGRIWIDSTPGEGTTFFFTLGRGEHAAAQATDPHY